MAVVEASELVPASVWSSLDGDGVLPSSVDGCAFGAEASESGVVFVGDSGERGFWDVGACGVDDGVCPVSPACREFFVELCAEASEVVGVRFFGNLLSIAARVRSAIACAGSFGAFGSTGGRYGASGFRTFGLCCAGVGWCAEGIRGRLAEEVAGPEVERVLADAALLLGEGAVVGAALGVGLVFAAAIWILWVVDYWAALAIPRMRHARPAAGQAEAHEPLGGLVFCMPSAVRTRSEACAFISSGSSPPNNGARGVWRARAALS